MPRGCKSELDDPPSFSPRPVIRLRPRPSFLPRVVRDRTSFYVRARREIHTVRDNSRRDTSRAYVLRVAKVPISRRGGSGISRERDEERASCREQGKTKGQTRHWVGRSEKGGRRIQGYYGMHERTLSSSVGRLLSRELHLPR